MAPPHLGRVLVVAGCRSDEASPSPVLEELRRHEQVAFRELGIAALDSASAHDLANAIIRAEPSHAFDLHRVVDEADGNPFFIEVLARQVYNRGALGSESVSLERILLEQVDGQSAEAQSLLAAIAVAGQPISEDVAIEAAGVGSGARTALVELRTAKFVKTKRAAACDLVETYHDRLRECVCSTLDPARVRECHSNLATALESRADTPPDFLARQFFGARRLDKAAQYALLAAEQAQNALAFEQAAALYALAAECQSDSAQAGELVARQASALVSSGRCLQAADRYLAAASVVSDERAFRFKRLAARQLFTAGHFERALELLQPFAQEAGIRFPDTPFSVLKAALLGSLKLKLRGVEPVHASVAGKSNQRLARRVDIARSVADGLASTDPLRAASVMLRGVALALELGEPTRVAWALAQYGLLVGSQGSSKKLAATALFERAEALAASTNDPDAAAIVRLNRAKLSLSLGSWHEAVAFADECSNFVRRECSEGWGYSTVAHNIALFALQTSGQLGELSRRANEYIRVARDVGDLYAEVSATIYSAAGALAADDVSAVDERIARALANWRKDHFLFQSWLVVHAQTQRHLYQDEPVRAYACIAGAWADLERRFLLKLWVVKPFALRLRAAAALSLAARHQGSERNRYMHVAQRDSRQLSRLRRPDALGWSHLIEGGLRQLRSDVRGASDAFATASRYFLHAGMPLEAASATLQRVSLSREAERAQLRGVAESELRRCGVRSPARWSKAVVGISPEAR
ncbi:MAG: hypothetical protein QM756_02400 [Polyangiaceae bacterium]